MTYLLTASGCFLLGYVLGATLASAKREDAAAQIWLCGHREGMQRAIQNQFSEGDVLSQWSEHSVH